MGPSAPPFAHTAHSFACSALLARSATRVLEAVDFRAASASAFVLPFPLPPECSHFTSSYPTHLFGSGCLKQPLPLPLPVRYTHSPARSLPNLLIGKRFLFMNWTRIFIPLCACRLESHFDYHSQHPLSRENKFGHARRQLRPHPRHPLPHPSAPCDPLNAPHHALPLPIAFLSPTEVETRVFAISKNTGYRRRDWRTDGPTRRTDGPTRRTDGPTDGRTDGRMDRRTDGQTNGWTDGRTDSQESSWCTAQWINAATAKDSLIHHIVSTCRIFLTKFRSPHIKTEDIFRLSMI